MADDPRVKRARGILHRLKSCEKITASAKALIPNGRPHDQVAFSAADQARAAQDWKFDIYAALRRCGRIGGKVLALHCLRQENSQRNSFITIGEEVGLTHSDAIFVFRVALTTFLDHLDKYGIPDDYAVQTTAAAAIAEMHAAADVGSECAVMTA